MWNLRKREVLSNKEFKITILCDNHTRSSSMTYTSIATTADEILSRLYTYIHDEPVVIVVDINQGKSVIIPRSNITSIEVLYLREHNEQD